MKLLFSRNQTIFFIVIFFVAFIFVRPVSVDANPDIERLRQEIEDRNSRLSEIEAEIANYESSLREVGAERQSLEQAIRQLELERSRVQADVQATQNRIDTANLTIKQLAIKISKTEESIDRILNGLAESIRRDYQASDDSMVLVMLRNGNMSDFWSELDMLATVRSSMSKQAEALQKLRIDLIEQQETAEIARQKLTELRKRYDDQNQVLVNNRSEQAELLRITQNEEDSYQRMLAERRNARAQIVSEMREFESELRFILDPTTIPQPGTTVFDWPLDNIVITQLFGGTEFAARNASVYGGRAYHPGVDFGSPRGTPIYAPLAGTVRAVGNTDEVPGCYSWGKWTLIDHANGLSTLYAHQDVIGVTPGQRVSTGEIIGYTGNTGFSTGPHLHFTVYVTDAVEVRQFNQIRTTTSCGSATTPVAAIEGYLDPMLYLPPHSAQPR